MTAKIFSLKAELGLANSDDKLPPAEPIDSNPLFAFAPSSAKKIARGKTPNIKTRNLTNRKSKFDPDTKLHFCEKQTGESGSDEKIGETGDNANQILQTEIEMPQIKALYVKEKARVRLCYESY